MDEVRWMTYVLLLVCLICTLSISVFADSTIAIKSVQNQISPSEQAVFEMSIINNEMSTQKYSIYSFVTGWNVEPSPVKDKIISINPGKKHTTKVVARPTDDLPPGIYRHSLIIESDSGERHTQVLKVYLSSDEIVDYLPSINVAIDMDEKINPKEPITIKLDLENRNPLNLSDLELRLQSDIPEFAKEVSVNLPPLQKKTVEFTIVPNEFQQPKDYKLFFVFARHGEDVKVVEKKIEIVTILSDFNVKINEEQVFLKTFTELSVKNGGNVINTQEVKYPVSFWQSLLISGSQSIRKEDEQRYLVWELNLSPNESKVLNFYTNYRLPLYVLLVITVFIIFYLIVQSPIELKKKAVTSRSDEEGGLSEIKITLEVRNKSTKVLSDISICDLVPAIANVEKSLELGTLKPQEIKHTKKGTKVIWNMAEIDAKEHRLITYKVRAKLSILGTFQLPRAVLGYKKGKRKGKSYSNIFSLRSL